MSLHLFLLLPKCWFVLSGKRFSQRQSRIENARGILTVVNTFLQGLHAFSGSQHVRYLHHYTLVVDLGTGKTQHHGLHHVVPCPLNLMQHPWQSALHLKEGAI